MNYLIKSGNDGHIHKPHFYYFMKYGNFLIIIEYSRGISMSTCQIF